MMMHEGKLELLLVEDCLVWRIKSCGSTFRFLRRRKCMLLAFVGICSAVLYFIGATTMNNDGHADRQKRSIRLRSYPGKHVHMTAHEVLHFPQDYHAKGVLSLPYGNIVEPFEAWFSAEHKMSRIDYYGGMDRTYQKELLGKHGFACKVVPEYSERTQKTYRGCLHRRGTKRFPVKAQSIIPASHYFKYVGDVKLRGRNSANWCHKFKIYNKVNTYILYTTKTKPLKPLRYEMMGYDTLLSSYYDHYVLDYEMFEPWHFNYTTLQIPTVPDYFVTAKKTYTEVDHVKKHIQDMLTQQGLCKCKVKTITLTLLKKQPNASELHKVYGRIKTKETYKTLYYMQEFKITCADEEYSHVLEYLPTEEYTLQNIFLKDINVTVDYADSFDKDEVIFKMMQEATPSKPIKEEM